MAVEGSWDPDVPIGGVAPGGVAVEGCGTCVEAGCVVKGRVGDIYVFFPFVMQWAVKKTNPLKEWHLPQRGER